MVNLIYKSTEHDYHLYKTNSVPENLMEFKFHSKQGYAKYKSIFMEKEESSTRGYTMYNLFQLTAGSLLFYNLYKDIKFVIFDYLKDKPELKYMWFSSWINYHTSSEVLDWHNHRQSVCHGYVSIDPKDTTTEFKKYSIKNEPGLIYIGPSDTLHRVNVDKQFEGNRITIGFDVFSDEKSSNLLTGFFPLA